MKRPGRALNTRREVTSLALAAAEACWVVPVFLALGQVGSIHSSLLTWLAFLVLLLAFFYIYRSLEAAMLPLRWQQGLLVLGLLLAIALFLQFHVYARAGSGAMGWAIALFRSLADVNAVDPGGWVAVMVLVYAWARGIHLARRSLSVDSVGFSFRAGVVILILEALFLGLALRSDLSGFILAYFPFALVAVGLARVEEVSQAPNSVPAGAAGFWIGWSLTAVALLILAGMVVAAFFYGGGLRQILAWLWPVVFVVWMAIAAVGALLLIVLERLLSLLSIDLQMLGQSLQDLLRRLGELLAVPPGLVPPGSNPLERPAVLGLLQVAVLLGIPLLVVGLVLLVTWFRRRRGERENRDESRESTFSAGAVARSLQAMLRAGLDRLGELVGLVDRFGLGSRFLAAVSIRRIYANLVRLATRLGYPRARSETPYEYLATLRRAMPGSETEALLITEAYINAHYGQVPDSAEELARIRACWERIRERAARE